jgi:predicted nucleic acid-binding protein
MSRHRPVARRIVRPAMVIAFLDAADDQHDRAVNELRPRLAAGDDLVVSAGVYAEVLVRPLQRGTHARVDEFLDAIGAVVIPIDREVARHAAQLRARHRSLRLPDALSLAAAHASEAELLTMDHRLRRIASRERATG